MTNVVNQFTSNYSRKEVDFLHKMGEGSNTNDTVPGLSADWVVLVTTPNVERGISVCSELREVLGSRVKVIRVNKISTISGLRELFDPDIILSDSNSIYKSEKVSEGEVNDTMNGMALFLNKKDSTFSGWIHENWHSKSFFNAWQKLND